MRFNLPLGNIFPITCFIGNTINKKSANKAKGFKMIAIIQGSMSHMVTLENAEV